jgi:beta-glucosidase-like glycosyl hydrolase
MSLVKDMAQVIGIELRSLWLQGVPEASGRPVIGLDCWSPNININRDPRWGRNQEVPGEDPYLTSQYGIAYTKGIQEGEDSRYLLAVVTLKHWACYSLENYKGVSRLGFNAVVTPYDQTNTYFVAWRASVTEGNAMGVMCSYNAVNGIPSCANKFLNDTLRGTFGFKGYVTSDSGAINCMVADHHYVPTLQQAAAAAITAGTDINSGGVYESDLVNALHENLISEKDIDNALYNQFKIRFQLGLFDPIENQPYWHYPPEAVNTPQSQALNMLATRQSLVLLKNEGSILPFAKGKSVAVLGPHGNAQGALVGNYIGEICPTNGFACITSPFTAITNTNKGGKTVYSQGCAVNSTSTAGFDAAIAAAKASDYVVLIIGIDQTIEREGYDRIDITLPGVQEQFAKMVIAVGKPTVVVLINGGIVAIDNLKPIAPAIIEAFYPGYWGGVALADVIFGDYNPGGKLPVTYFGADYINQSNFLSMSMTDSPGRTYRYYTGTPLWEFGFGLSYTTFTLNWTTSEEHRNSISNEFIDYATYKVVIKNTGKIAGDEVAQAYFSPPSGPLKKQLFGFERVHLEPNQEITLTFQTTYETFKLADEEGNTLSTPGTYKIIFTNGADQILTTYLEVTGETRILEKFLY